jgi:hypothetical protein
VVGFGEYGDEPSGSCATELVMLRPASMQTNMDSEK